MSKESLDSETLTPLGDGKPLGQAIRFDVNYYSTNTGEKVWSHKYEEEWERLDLFCPRCGRRTVWHETGAGDYYLSELYLCASCKSRFYLPTGVKETNNDEDEQRLMHLKPALSPRVKNNSGVRVFISKT